MKLLTRKKELELEQLLARMNAFDNDALLVLQQSGAAVASMQRLEAGIYSLLAAVESLTVRVDALEEGRKGLN